MKRKYSKQKIKNNSKQKKGGDVTLCKISKFLNKVINISDLCKKIDLSFDYELENIIKNTIKIVDKEIKNISLPIGKNNILEILNDDLYEDVKSFFDENYLLLDGGSNSNDEIKIDIDDDDNDDVEDKDFKVLQYFVDNVENIKAISIAIVCSGIFGALIATPLAAMAYPPENDSPFYHPVIVGIKAVVAGLGGFGAKKIITKIETICRQKSKELHKVMRQKEFKDIYDQLVNDDDNELLDELLQNNKFKQKIKERIQQMDDTSINKIEPNDEINLPKVPSGNADIGVPDEINSLLGNLSPEPKSSSRQEPEPDSSYRSSGYLYEPEVEP